jgi:hypothetical protein
MVMRSLIRAVYRFRDPALVEEKKGDFGNALQNLYRELKIWLALLKSFRSLRFVRFGDSVVSSWSRSFFCKPRTRNSTKL